MKILELRELVLSDGIFDKWGASGMRLSSEQVTDQDYCFFQEKVFFLVIRILLGGLLNLSDVYWCTVPVTNIIFLKLSIESRLC